MRNRIAIAALLALTACAGHPIPAQDAQGNGYSIQDKSPTIGQYAVAGACMVGIAAIGVVVMNPAAVAAIPTCL